MSRFRRIATAFALYLGAVAVGVGSAWWVLRHAPWLNAQMQVGAWRTHLAAGSQDADMYTRASVALNGLLALGRSETMYFVATHDDAGHPLRSRCNYRVSGVPPQARWWSITAYAEDMFLFDAPHGRYSLNGTTALLDLQGRFHFTIGQKEQTGMHWLPTPGDRGVTLTLRMYNPGPELQANPGALAAPSIVPLEACG
ncbi:MAG: DUF1214 domain-containing protein [Rhodoferax sp.]|nr:DUF1214 domain-containing protein [Rhodoferax sp.]